MSFIFTLDYTKILQLITQFHDYNRAMNSDDVQYQMKKTHAETLRVLLLLYAKQLIKYFNQASLEEYYKQHNELPPFRTFACSVQKTCKMASKSTFYDQRRRLMNTGALLKVENDPSQMHQLWYFNPVFFANNNGEEYVKKYVKEHFSARKTLEAQVPKFDVFALLGTVSVPVLTYNRLLNKNIVSHVNNVDKSNHQQIRSASHSKNITGEPTGNVTRNTGKLVNFLPENLKNLAGQAKKPENLQVAPRESAKKTGSKQKIPAFILKMVVEFWLYAKANLYAGEIFTEEEERSAKNLIYTQYFSNWRKYSSEKQWQAKLQNLKKQVDISRRSVERNGYSVPGPNYYFAPRDPHAQTEFKFYKTYEMLAKQVYEEVRLELRRWQRGKGRCKNMSAKDLMKRHFGKLAEVGHQRYIDHFTHNISNRYVRKY